MTLRGVVGRVEWGAFTAAAIEGYTVSAEKGDPTFHLTATVVLADRYNLRQQPLFFVAPHAHGSWRWPIQTLRLECGVLTAEMGAPR